MGMKTEMYTRCRTRPRRPSVDVHRIALAVVVAEELHRKRRVFLDEPLRRLPADRVEELLQRLAGRVPRLDVRNRLGVSTLLRGQSGSRSRRT